MSAVPSTDPALAPRSSGSDAAVSTTEPPAVGARPVTPKLIDEPIRERSHGGGDDGRGGAPDGEGGDGGGRGHESGPPIPLEKFAMWLLLCSLVMLFAGFMAAYTVLRSGTDVWPPAGMPPLPQTLWINTGLIILSSVTMQWAFWSIRHGRSIGLKIGLCVTTLLGAAFVAGQIMVWQDLFAQGVEMSTHTYGAIFYTLTGLHAAHVVVGIFYLLVVTARALLGRYTPERCLGVELCGMYWHFVDVIWLGLVVVLFVA